MKKAASFKRLFFLLKYGSRCVIMEVQGNSLALTEI